MNDFVSAFKMWNMAAFALKDLKKYDDCVYKVAKEFWENDPLNSLSGKSQDRLYDMMIYAISDGRERSFWEWSDRFDSPGASKGDKPISWDLNRSSHRFGPEALLYGLFNEPSRRGFILAKEIYEKMRKDEEEFHEAKTGSPDRKGPKNRKG